MAGGGLFAAGGLAAFGLASGPGFFDASDPGYATSDVMHRYMAYKAFNKAKGNDIRLVSA